jgi:thymidylate synthase (FAD)
MSDQINKDTSRDPIRVLDSGFVRLENFSGGGDASVVRAARVSYGSESVSEEKDKKLIAYMLKHRHGTPFEHNSFTFHVKAPIFVFRQWHRTRIGVSYNEVSARYSEMKDDFYLPTVWRAQDTKNKQGSVAAALPHQDCERIASEASAHAMQAYRDLLKNGVAREMARMVLPVSLYSEMYFTVNARALMFFIGLRSDAHAQWETQQYSNALAHYFRIAMPWTYEAFYQTLDKSQYVGLPEPIGTVHEVA